MFVACLFIFVLFLSIFVHVWSFLLHFCLFLSFVVLFCSFLVMLCIGWIRFRVACVRHHRAPRVAYVGCIPPADMDEENENKLTSELVHLGILNPKRREKQGGSGWEGAVNRGDACPLPPPHPPTLFVQDMYTRLLSANLDFDSELQHVFWWEPDECRDSRVFHVDRVFLRLC